MKDLIYFLIQTVFSVLVIQSLVLGYAPFIEFSIRKLGAVKGYASAEKHVPNNFLLYFWRFVYLWISYLLIMLMLKVDMAITVNLANIKLS